MSEDIKRGYFNAGSLMRVAEAPNPDVPPLIIGDRCTLNSGSPAFLVVDTDDHNVVVAWRFEGKTIERMVPRVCVRRVQ